MRRIGVLALVVLAVPLRAAPSAAAANPPPIVFPVVGNVSYQDTWGAPRGGGRSHIGQDLMAEKMQPLVAAAAGTVSWITLPQASYGYMVTITDDAGWSYHYVHLNNDTPGTDDGAAQLSDVFAPGIELGAPVAAGQLIGYVGDSGNAENVAPQLHFEIEDPSGEPVNPMAALDAAVRVARPADGIVDATHPGAHLPRLAGPDRVATALALSREGWQPDVAAAVIADASRWDEALPAASLAAALGGPLLLVSNDVLGTAVREELRRLRPARIITVGSVAVTSALVADGFQPEHIGRPGDAIGTAAEIAERSGASRGVLLVSSSSAADAVTAAALAADPARPILFSRRDTVPQVVVDAWRRLGRPAVTVVGGSGVIGDNVQSFFGAARIAGATRYGTSAAAAEAALAAGRSPDRLLIATGSSFADALALAPFAAVTDAAAILVDGTGAGADQEALSWLSRRARQSEVTIIGGVAAVSHPAEDSVARALGLELSSQDS